MRPLSFTIFAVLCTTCAFALIWTGAALYKISGTNNHMTPAHIVLIGASIGQAWRLPEWPARMHLSGVTAESIPVWQFDKTAAVDEMVRRPSRTFHPSRSFIRSLFGPAPKKPQIVILKECSSYFPGNNELYQSRMRSWIDKLRPTGANVILATVAPVTRHRASLSPGKMDGIISFNQWIRTYARQQGLAVLDLEGVLRDRNDPYLRDEFATDDGSHLTAAGYSVLDQLLQSVVCRTMPGKPCSVHANAPAR